MDRLHSIICAKKNREILALLNSPKYGTPKNQVEILELNFASRKPEDGEAYYYYNGPLDDKTRQFCSLMLHIDKVFSETEIQKISDELNYDVLKYMGSYNCRHQWIRFRGRIISTPPPTMREVRKLINAGIEHK